MEIICYYLVCRLIEEQLGAGFKDATGSFYFFFPEICMYGDIGVVSEVLIYSVLSALALIQKSN